MRIFFLLPIFNHMYIKGVFFWLIHNTLILLAVLLWMCWWQWKIFQKLSKFNLRLISREKFFEKWFLLILDKSQSFLRDLIVSDQDSSIVSILFINLWNIEGSFLHDFLQNNFSRSDNWFFSLNYNKWVSKTMSKISAIYRKNWMKSINLSI